MGKAIDLKGQKFGRLTVLYRDGSSKDRVAMWKCKCDCGKETTTQGRNLRSGRTTSCGCFLSESSTKRATKHGLYKTRIYRIYKAMKSRCNYPKNKDYLDYGGRGIKICRLWEEDFESFYMWSMSNGYKDSLTIDRIDVNKGYSPCNCKWSTSDEQSINKRNIKLIEYENELKPLSTWCNFLGVSYWSARRLCSKGMAPNKVLGYLEEKKEGLK